MFECDFLIIGGGIAGLSAALEASQFGKVTLLTKGKIGETATKKAQGGIAAAVDQIRDSTQFHFEDTIASGAGLCDETAVRILVTEGVERVKELIEMGAQFDRAATEAGGGFALGLEAAHKRRRILHAGDATGEEIQRTLGSRLVGENKAAIFQNNLGVRLLVQDNRCAGALSFDLNQNEFNSFSAKAVIIATGGIGQLYLFTTNPPFATGDGIALAYRAGAEVTDLEFIQFHPTSLVQSKEFEDMVALPQFLISEAVRGEGGVLLNHNGERFINELAPRDIVARAIAAEMNKTGSDHVLLSLANVGAEKIKNRFPVIYKTCLERGLDITKDPIPVAPAAHYFMGGIKTDVDGKTSLAGLYAAGECASLGVHGANRLASNSLLDGLVFGHRAAVSASSSPSTVSILQPYNPSTFQPRLKEVEVQRYKLVIKSAMWNGVGIIRSKESLEQALGKLKRVEEQLNFEPQSVGEIELMNMLLAAKLITRAALDRTESRGAHYRSDFPAADDKSWKRHLTYRQG